MENMMTTYDDVQIEEEVGTKSGSGLKLGLGIAAIGALAFGGYKLVKKFISGKKQYVSCDEIETDACECDTCEPDTIED